ncbi:MAG: SRPBCC family protein [Intrasporangium sp.]|uniref:SRPBCC family protein n=1 Tax=Intrasporangium sp. TaxID=1925024 RepID=UPI003F7D6E2F
MEIERTVTTAAPPGAVFRYLADFTTTTEWDPGTVRTTRVRGDGGIGTTYRNTSRFLGRETQLTYVVERFVPGRVVHLRGENRSVLADDTITFAQTPSGGTRVTYRAAFSFKGFARLVAPLFAPALRRLGDEAERGLYECLDRLGA